MVVPINKAIIDFQAIKMLAGLAKLKNRPIQHLFPMKTHLIPLLFLISTGCHSQTCTPCDRLKDLKLPDVTITKAEAFATDTIKDPQPWVPTVNIRKPFCRVQGTISKEIN